MLRSGTAGLMASAAVLIMAMAAPAGANDFYAGKTIDLIVRKFSRRRVRYLRAHRIAASGPPYSRQSRDSGQEHAGRRRSEGRTLYQRRFARDGLTIGAIMPGTIMEPLLDEKPDLSFDPTQVDYLGTANTGSYICVTLDHSKTKTFAQALTQKTIMGGIAAGNSTNDIANLIKKMTGAQFDIVSGYKGTLDIALAIERGELDGVCGWNCRVRTRSLSSGTSSLCPSA